MSGMLAIRDVAPSGKALREWALAVVSEPFTPRQQSTGDIRDTEL